MARDDIYVTRLVDSLEGHLASRPILANYHRRKN